MLVGKAIQGDAGNQLKAEALDWIYQLAKVEGTIKAMLDSMEIMLLVQVSPGDDDQTTTTEWKNGKTHIIVTVFTDESTEGASARVREDLLHELVLHAKPAADKHLAAVQTNASPIYATTESDIEAEETAEHAAASEWHRMATIAIKLNNSEVLDRVFTDAATHNLPMAHELLDQLLAENQVSSDYAEEIRESALV